MEQKINSRENAPKKTFEEIKKDFEDATMRAIARGELNVENFVKSFRKDMDEIMGRIVAAVEKKRF